MVSNQVVTKQTVYIHRETTNQSFIDMHYYLKSTGRVHNDFFLALYDSGLAGVDPRDPLLTPIMKQRILRECICNYWYFLREVVRIPVQGGTVGSGIRYKLHRGNLAMNFLFTLNYNQFVELPRQHFKTTSAVIRYCWCYNFGTSNSEIMFIHKDHGGSKGNLNDLKEIRDALPEYLQMSAATAIDGRKLKVKNTVETMQHPINNNKIITFPSARSKDMADKLGRGCTMPMQYYDEFAFMLYNQYVYTAAVPAYSRAAENAKANQAPYGLLITTTPGDLTTQQGMYAYSVRNSATPWNEAYYDYSLEQLEQLRLSNTNSSFFLVSYSYQQLGSGEDYFKRMVVDLLRDWQRIRREVMLEWSKTATNCPFKQDDLDIIQQYCREPIRTILFGRVGQYQFHVYKDLDLRYPPIIGVDVAGSMYQDSSAITVIDSRTTEVTATLNSNYIPTDDLADTIYTLVTRYMSNAIVNVERNGGFGVSVIQRLTKTSIKKNLYYEIKDKVIEESYDGVRTNRRSAKVRVFGTDSTKEVRARLIEILFDRVQYHKDKFIAPILHRELSSMETKKNGKVEHSSESHDDQVFSYLMAMRVWYDGENLMENYGIQKTTIKSDEEIEIEVEDIGGVGKVRLDVDEVIDEEDDELGIQAELNYLRDAARYRLGNTFNNEIYMLDQQTAEFARATNKELRRAYEEKYNMSPEENGVSGVQYISLPSNVFNMDDTEDGPSNRNGNLFDIFNSL